MTVSLKLFVGCRANLGQLNIACALPDVFTSSSLLDLLDEM